MSCSSHCASLCAHAVDDGYLQLTTARVPSTQAASSPILRGPTAVELRGLSALPTGMVSSRNIPRKRRKNQELNRAVGNDGPIPWLRAPPSRSEEFHSVESVPVSAFFTTSTVTPTYGAFSFTLSSLADASALTSVFEQYIVRELEVLIEPQVSEVTTPTGDVGELLTVIDIDDANNPSSLADLGSYPSLCQTRATQAHYHRWVPGVAIAAYSGVFTSFAATTSMWLDCGSPNILHYGLKGGNAAAAVAQILSIQVRAHLSFRGRH